MHGHKHVRTQLDGSLMLCVRRDIDVLHACIKRVGVTLCLHGHGDGVIPKCVGPCVCRDDSLQFTQSAAQERARDRRPEQVQEERCIFMHACSVVVKY